MSLKNSTFVNNFLEESDYLEVVLHCLVGGLSFIGNVFSMLTIATSRRLRSDTTNLFLANLALSDTLHAVTVFVLGLEYLGVHTLRLPEFACRMQLMMSMLCSHSSNLTIACVAIYKLCRLKFPMKCEHPRLPVFIVITILLCWTLPSIFNVSVVFYGYGVLLFIPSHCNLILNANAVLQYLCMFCLPQYAIIVTASFFILRIVRHHMKNISSLRISINSSSSSTEVSTEKSDSGNKKSSSNQQIATSSDVPAPPSGKNDNHNPWKAVRMFICVALLFILLQAPIYSITLAYALCGTCVSPKLYHYAMFPYFTNGLANVFTYFIAEKRFRKAGWILLTGKCLTYSRDH